MDGYTYLRYVQPASSSEGNLQALMDVPVVLSQQVKLVVVAEAVVAGAGLAPVEALVAWPVEGARDALLTGRGDCAAVPPIKPVANAAPNPPPTTTSADTTARITGQSRRLRDGSVCAVGV